MTAHWGILDPANAQATRGEIERAFKNAFTALDRQISLFLPLPIAALDRFALQRKIDEMGKAWRSDTAPRIPSLTAYGSVRQEQRHVLRSNSNRWSCREGVGIGNHHERQSHL
jgi:hypothetical protein